MGGWEWGTLWMGEGLVIGGDRRAVMAVAVGDLTLKLCGIEL